MKMISILVLLLLLGVAAPRHISYYDDDVAEEPIISLSQERRICAELCMAGLGGKPCGDICWDVMPQGLPTITDQSSDDIRKANYTRKDACPVLCANQLGYPLCNCDYKQPDNTPFFRPDYMQICSFYCTRYNYKIYGCSSCDKIANYTPHSFVAPLNNMKPYDWNEWCRQMCQEGDGGSACYCDLLPMGMKL